MVAVEVIMVVVQVVVDLVVEVEQILRDLLVQETHLPLVQVKDQTEAAAVVQI